MPFTPYHIGPHLLLGLALIVFIDIPTFILANVVTDIQPLLVIMGFMSPPVHGFSHTFVGGGIIGLILGIISMPFIPFYRRIFKFTRLPYNTSKITIVISAILGCWFHVITDAPIYADIEPLFPFFDNPVKESLSYHFVTKFCLACFPPALILLLLIMRRHSKKAQ